MKNDPDFILTALSKDKKIHVYATHTFNTTNTAQKKHHMNIISSSIFSRALNAAVLLGGNLKNKEDIISLQWKCTGSIQSIYTECNYEGHVKGYVGENNLELINNSIINNTIIAEPYIGLGEIVISRKTFDNRPAYNSVSIIETGEIAQDISIYLQQSLQIHSAIKIGLAIDNNNQINASGGILFMAMPGASEKEMKKIADLNEQLDSFTQFLQKNSDNIKEKITQFLQSANFQIISTKPVIFKCHCKKSTIGKILKSLQPENFSEYITEQGEIEATCQYCGKTYRFTPIEVKNI